MSLSSKKVLSNEDCEKIDETVDKYLDIQTEKKKESDFYYNYLNNLEKGFIYKEKGAKGRFVFYSLIMYFYGLTPLINHLSIELSHIAYSLSSLISGLFLTMIMGLRTKRMALFRRKMDLRTQVMSEKLNTETINGFCRMMPNEQAKNEFLEYLSNAKEKNLFIVKSFVRKQKRLA